MTGMLRGALDEAAASRWPSLRHTADRRRRCRPWHYRSVGGSGTRRNRLPLTTLKCPIQSVALAMTVNTSVTSAPAVAGPVRNNTTPQAGREPRKTSSPKSLSNVRRTRWSSTAFASTAWSVSPAKPVVIHSTSWPADRSPSTASTGIFSSARNRPTVDARAYA